MLKKDVLAVLLCALASLGTSSCAGSEQVARERQKQAAIEAFDKKQAEDARAIEGGVATKEDREKRIQRDLDADKEIANLRSPDRDVVNHAIMMGEYYRACKGVPDLMHLLKESPDDYIAGLSAQAIAVCNERTTFDAIIDEFLRRKTTPVMVDAIGKINTTDPRVIEKIKKLIAEPNEDEDVPVFARRVKTQIEMSLNKSL
jgi:hypothetical protein